MATKWNDKGGVIAAKDTLAFAFGSIAEVGDKLNQPRETCRSTWDSSNNNDDSDDNDFSYRCLRNSNENNSLMSGILNGGFRPLSQEIMNRNRADIQHNSRQQNVWYINTGKEVQIVVNKAQMF